MANISTKSAPGAQLYIQPQGRYMKSYAVTESDLKHVALMNTLGGVFCSVGSFWLAFAVGIYTQAAFQPREATAPQGLLLADLGVWVLVGLAVLFYWAGWKALQTRNSTWQQIKQETIPPNEPA